ncbi:hypothetical protein BD310DRAFT_828553 [Dichomitus squalens]|uniref:Uncharacterized protein n=1 Tax=Dichomitus squalens TaxID=114155 RepID=A0A4Q9PJA7_9APHY|nr:hypothetical protein BD310DRAFT_828553 [Dichomitus squalens]
MWLQRRGALSQHHHVMGGDRKGGRRLASPALRLPPPRHPNHHSTSGCKSICPSMHPAQMLQAMQDVARGKKVPSFMTRLKKFRAGYKVRSNPAPVPHDNRAAGTTLEPDDQKNTQQSLQTIAPNPHSRPQRPRIRIPLIARNSSPSTETCVHDGGCESPLESYPTTLVGSPASWSPKTASRSSLLTLDSPEEKKALQPPTSPEDLEASEEDDGARDERQWRDERSRPIARNDHGEGAPSCVTNPRPSPLSLVDLAPSSTPPRPAPLHALQGALGETVWYMIGSQLDQHDLTRFAMICSETLLAAESLIHRHPAIRDEDTMVAWAAALERNSDRAHLVQSLTVGWDTEEDVKGDAAIAFAAAIELLRASKNLHTLNVFATATAGNFGSGHILPASVRTLNTSGAFFSRVEQPLPFLRHLSIRVEANDLNKLRTPISLCRETLIQLRICLKWPSPMRKREDNPVRLCSHLDAPNLVYLELHEERSEDAESPVFGLEARVG